MGHQQAGTGSRCGSALEVIGGTRELQVVLPATRSTDHGVAHFWLRLLNKLDIFIEPIRPTAGTALRFAVVATIDYGASMLGR